MTRLVGSGEWEVGSEKLEGVTSLRGGSAARYVVASRRRRRSNLAAYLRRVRAVGAPFLAAEAAARRASPEATRPRQSQTSGAGAAGRSPRDGRSR